MRGSGDGVLDSAWMKWAWGWRHAAQLLASIDERANAHEPGPLIPVRREYHPARHCISVYLTASLEPSPHEWSVQLGDLAHNFRSCLDNLAWALVRRGATPPETLSSNNKRNGIYFPICADRKVFNSELPGKLPGVRRADVAIVRRYQPYVAGSRRAKNHSLKILSGISNDDKHRAVRPVLFAPQAGSVKLHSKTDCEVTRIAPRGKRVEMKAGTEIHRLYVRRTGPNPDVDVEYEVVVKPMLLDERVVLGDWIAHTGAYIEQLLLEFGPRPLFAKALAGL